MDRTQNVILRSELERDEKRCLEPYKDTLGNWTIGVGHLLGAEKRMLSITNPECNALLDYDIRAAELLAIDIFSTPWPLLGDVRQRALVNMAFNLGTKLRGFKKMIAAIQDQDFDKAGTEMAASRWATQVGARAVRLRAMIEKGVA